MKLKRAVEINDNMVGLEGTSKGAYYVVDTPFIVLQDSLGHWFLYEKTTSGHPEWTKRNGLEGEKFPTRAQALDSLAMALEVDPL